MDYFSMVLATVITFAVTSVSGVWLIPLLEKLHLEQSISKEGPTWHKRKTGTPTMGGLIFILGSIIGIAVGLVSLKMNNPYASVGKVAVSFTFAFSLGLIGFIDDYIIAIRKENEGLTEGQKTILELIVTVIYLVAMRSYGVSTAFWIPFIGYIELGWFYYPVAILIIFATVNAVNFTDGIDGLCSSVTSVVALGFMVACAMLSSEYIVIAGVLLGACAGFLIWNWNPAKVFMGDTGSLFLGGVVVAIAFGIGRPFIILFFGIVYVWEALSVLIQRIYYKATKKRLFKMTPIHHSFEISGYSEKKIVLIFSGVALIGVIIGLLLLKYDLQTVHKII